jgi:hypothetical protein
MCSMALAFFECVDRKIKPEVKTFNFYVMFLRLGSGESEFVHIWVLTVANISLYMCLIHALSSCQDEARCVRKKVFFLFVLFAY